MRIGISTSVVQRGKTGIAQYLFGLLRGLMEVALENEYVLFVLDEDAPLLAFAREAMQIVRVPESVRSPVRDIAWHQTELPRLARQMHLDVLHVPSYRRMVWTSPCPTVATIHDLAPFHVNRKYDWKRMLYGRVVARRLAHRQDAIIAISQNTARDIATYFGVPENKIEVIHNGIDHSEFFPASAGDARKQVGIEQPFLLYVARLEHPGKNHVRLIEAFNQFKQATGSDWQLVLGGSDWTGAEHIHRAIKESPCARDIRTLGFVPAEKLLALYRAASVFVYPSLYEGFGMPPLEAMACGCPVISSTGGALREMVGDAGILVKPHDTAGLARELGRIATDSALREQLRTAGLAHARQFTWQAAARATANVYARAAKRAVGVASPGPELVVSD
jgi:glycosyltransferase involved in cell wall biosynthesis